MRQKELRGKFLSTIETNRDLVPHTLERTWSESSVPTSVNQTSRLNQVSLDDQRTLLESCFTANFAVSRMLSLSSLKPTTYVPRYPRWMVGRPLLVATSALASLGDAMFGYSQGIIAANQVQPSFIKRMFGKDVTMEQIQTSTTGVNPFMAGA